MPQEWVVQMLNAYEKKRLGRLPGGGGILVGTKDELDTEGSGELGRVCRGHKEGNAGGLLKTPGKVCH